MAHANGRERNSVSKTRIKSTERAMTQPIICSLGFDLLYLLNKKLFRDGQLLATIVCRTAVAISINRIEQMWDHRACKP